MKVFFDGKEYQKRGRNGTALKDLCFSIFKKYLSQNPNIEYIGLKNIFNQWHCNNRKVLLTENEWLNQTPDGKSRYFKPINYNNENLYFTTQWGNNGGECDNVNKVISFAQTEGYKIEILEDDTPVPNSTNTTFDNKISVNIKNIILYGSPGVGKTYNTKKLISLIEDGYSEKEIFETIKNNEENNGINIDDLKDRVKFVTFHQSFGYEDFIEGFRPNEEGNIELEDGVFKLICQSAQKNLEDSQKPSEAIHQERKFNTILNDFIEEIENLLENNGTYPLTKNIYIFDIEEDAFRYKGDNWNIHSAGLRMRFDILEKLYLENVKSRQDVKEIDGVGGLATQHATYFWKFLEKLYTFENQQNIQIEEVEQVEQKNYYLVIDEINRGNISKIFGELITLIEEDKRDTLEVTLPYSKKPFKIPSNLYIIGTMNSTDKSIALIDIALRRRFTFLKMEPNLDLVVNNKAKNIMKQLNDKIMDTLGADYVLGHSYFMKIENDDDLDFVLEYKIKPLLEEYFYGDDIGLKDVLKICNVNDSVLYDNE